MELRDKGSQLPSRELTQGDRAVLYGLLHSDGYRVLVDILHRFVSEQETALINTAPEDERAVLSQWHQARAAWAMFTRMQRIALEASGDYAETLEEDVRLRNPAGDRSTEEVLGFE